MDLADLDYHLPERATAQRPAEPATRLAPGGCAHGGRRPAPARWPTWPSSCVSDVLVVNTTPVRPPGCGCASPAGARSRSCCWSGAPAGDWEGAGAPQPAGSPGTRFAAGPDLDVEVGGEAATAPGGDPARGRRRGRAGGARPLRHRPAAALHPHPAGRPRALPDGVRRAPGVGGGTHRASHLTPQVLDRCRAAGARVEPVELLVGMGTFRPMSRPRSKTTTCTPSVTVPPAPWRLRAGAGHGRR